MQRIVLEGLIHARSNLHKIFDIARNEIDWDEIVDCSDMRVLADSLLETFIDTIEDLIHTQVVSMETAYDFQAEVEASCLDIFEDEEGFLKDFLGMPEVPEEYVKTFNTIANTYTDTLRETADLNWVSIIDEYQGMLAGACKAYNVVAWISSYGTTPCADSVYLLFPHDLELVQEHEVLEDGEFTDGDMLEQYIQYCEGVDNLDISCGFETYIFTIDNKYTPSPLTPLEIDTTIRVYHVTRSTQK